MKMTVREAQTNLDLTIKEYKEFEAKATEWRHYVADARKWLQEAQAREGIKQNENTN